MSCGEEMSFAKHTLRDIPIDEHPISAGEGCKGELRGKAVVIAVLLQESALEASLNLRLCAMYLLHLKSL